MPASTSHMVTALVLLNGFVTFWALFCICDKPCRILTFTAVFIFPFFYHLTHDWIMLFFSAFKTKLLSTFASYWLSDVSRSWFNCILTVGFRAPPYIFIEFGEWHCYIFLIQHHEIFFTVMFYYFCISIWFLVWSCRRIDNPLINIL